MKRLLVLLTSVVVLFISTTCSDKTGVGPDSIADGHILYIAPIEGNMIRVFSIERGTFIDSMVVDSASADDTLRLHVIGNNSMLAVSTETKTFLVDLRTKKVVDSFEATHPVFSRDSRYYYTAGSVRTFPGNAELFNQPGGMAQARFCNRSEIVSFVYFINSDTADLVVYDIPANSGHSSIIKMGDFVLGQQMLYCSPYPIKSLNKVFLNIGPVYAVTDFFSDSVRTLKWDGWGIGAPNVISPDEKYSFYTDVGLQSWGYVPSGYVYVYDAATEDSLAAIHFRNMSMADLLLVTEDSRYLVARMRYEYGWDDNTTICLIDIQNMAVVAAYDCGFKLGDISSKYCAVNGLDY